MFTGRSRVRLSRCVLESIKSENRHRPVKQALMQGGGRWEDSAARARPLAAVTTRTKPSRGSNGFSMCLAVSFMIGKAGARTRGLSSLISSLTIYEWKARKGNESSLAIANPAPLLHSSFSLLHSPPPPPIPIPDPHSVFFILPSAFPFWPPVLRPRLCPQRLPRHFRPSRHRQARRFGPVRREIMARCLQTR